MSYPPGRLGRPFTLARLLTAGLCVASCTKSPAATRSTAPSAPKAATDPIAWRYEVRFEAGGELAIEANFAKANDGVLTADNQAAPYVRRVEFARGASWASATSRGAAWSVPCGSGCRVRYTFALREACAGLAQADTAVASGDVLIAPASTWLLHPRGTATGAQFELHVQPGSDGHFVTAFHPLPGRADSYSASTDVLDDATFAAFGPLQVTEVTAGDTTLQLAVSAQGLALTSEQTQAWVRASAGAVASYYQGHLPARHALVLLIKGSGNDTHGLTLGGGGPAVLVQASDLVNPATTREDWVLTHELLHVNFPDVGPAHAWLSEGLATYLEPIARARVGLITEAEVWRGLIDGLPQGLPRTGDQGLERTRTWGRTYWGGALFCLLADVTLRERTGNQRSLDDVLLAIGKAGASDEDHWPLSRVLDAAERATGTPVVSELYERLAQKPGTVDLAALFARLGVRSQGNSVAFDDAAPLAAIRRSIAARRPG